MRKTWRKKWHFCDRKQEIQYKKVVSKIESEISMDDVE